MANLVSPGVAVSIIDQSQYLAAPANSVPLIILATATNKANATGTGVATATTKANSGKLYQVTSQRDLVTLFGNPFFYKTQNGTPIQGYELNEYGLLAAYSVLGVTNNCYVIRADIDLASMVGAIGRPSGSPVSGSYWLDTTTSTWGIYEFSAVSGKFTERTPIVITDVSNLTGDMPKGSLGSVGDYAVNAIKQTTAPATSKAFFYKNSANQWVEVGSTSWLESVPTVSGTTSSPTLVSSDTFKIIVNNTATTITVPPSPSNTVQGLADAINAAGIAEVSASVTSNRLRIYSKQAGTDKTIKLQSLTGTPLVALGIVDGTYYQPEVSFGGSSKMPLWSASQTKPHPTGSIWMKVGASGTGSQYVLNKYNASTSSYASVAVDQFSTDVAALARFDSTGGMAIPVNTVYAQYSFGNEVLTSPVYFWKRDVTGATIVTGDNTAPTFVTGSKLKVQVSIPGATALSDVYTVTITGTDADAFETAWSNAYIPGTKVVVTSAGAIQISHLYGGEIMLSNGDAHNAIAAIGLTAGSTSNVKVGPRAVNSFTAIAPSSTTSTAGANAKFTINTVGAEYSATVTTAGSGYVVGDNITVLGSALGGTAAVNDLHMTVTSVGTAGELIGVSVLSGVNASPFTTQLSNWVAFDYIANEGAPKVDPVNNANWFYSTIDEVDIMVNVNGEWKGYRNTAFDSNGKPTAGTNSTDITGPIIAASAPEVQVSGSALSYGDLWIDSSDLDNYPLLNRWVSIDGVDQWVRIDNTDQVSDDGIVFADARWATNGTVDIINDPIPTIKSLLSSDYLDLDAPSPDLYPQGTLLFNTRRSGYTIKQFKKTYFNGKTFSDQTLPAYTNAWVTVSGNKSDGSAYMGRKAQRNMIVQALRAATANNQDIREEDLKCNLIAAPGYPELQPDMITLNNDRNNTSYIIGDTPMRLPAQATDIAHWATNAKNASSTGEEGLVTVNEYMGVFYPSGMSTDLTGASVAVPASHMMLRTFLRNDQVAYPWFAAAGTRRGNIDNATGIGYLDAKTGEFQTIKTGQGLRDVLYANNINPLAYFTGVGLVNYGNKNVKDTQSSMNRTNVARLVAYIRERLAVAVRPFIFEPNDRLTRQQVQGVIQSLFIDINSKRGLNDFLVVCDESNNTSDRIDRNELWIDIAIEPIHALEFVYIPVRIMNTGAIAKL